MHQLDVIVETRLPLFMFCRGIITFHFHAYTEMELKLGNVSPPSHKKESLILHFSFVMLVAKMQFYEQKLVNKVSSKQSFILYCILKRCGFNLFSKVFESYA